MLIANNGTLIDSIQYDSKWGIKGNSLERLRYFEFDNDSTNWGASEVTGTPTTINSIATYFDLAMIDVTLVPDGFRIILENKGNITSLQGRIDVEINGSLVAFYYIDSIAAFSDKEIILDPSNIGYTPKIKDKLRFIAKTGEDINIYNDDFTIFIPNTTTRGDVLINEIMYNIDDTQFEFIELYNNSAVDVQISNWHLADDLDLKNGRYNQIITNINLLPNEYAIIVCDEAVYKVIDESKWDKILFTKKKFSLNNTTDNINIYNEHKQLIDSVEYSDTWHEDYLSSTKNISLEKIRPTLISSDESNWKTCTDPSGTTILASNSYSNNATSEKSISVVPNPFAPISSNKPYALIEYKLPFDNALIDCDIFYPNGNLAVSLIQSKFTSNSGTLNWNGRDSDNKVLPIGPYIVMIEATDQDSGESEILKAVIVLAQ